MALLEIIVKINLISICEGMRKMLFKLKYKLILTFPTNNQNNQLGNTSCSYFGRIYALEDCKMSVITYFTFSENIFVRLTALSFLLTIIKYILDQ